MILRRDEFLYDVMKNTGKLEIAGSNGRIELVDALRGFALFMIVILHCAEQYNLLNTPEYLPQWAQNFDKGLLSSLFFLFGGKAYAIFSLLFGFSFYVQIRNQQARGVDFRWRFIWRMVLLFAFGVVHSCYYPGDILMLYAVVGLVLVPFARVSNKAVLIVAILFMLQPLEWGRIIWAVVDPDFTVSSGSYVPYYTSVRAAITQGTFWEAVKVNVWDGVLYSNLWAVENGRPFQTAALFLFGMLLGRTRAFEKSERSRIFWTRVLRYALIAAVPLYAVRYTTHLWLDEGTIRTSVDILALSLSNFTLAAIITSGFTLLWFRGKRIMRAERFFAPFGRMSLTNYLGQSLFGTVIFFGWGFGMYRWFGTLACVACGVIIFLALRWFSVFWLSRHRQGPLETLWKRGTWLFSRRTAGA